MALSGPPPSGDSPPPGLPLSSRHPPSDDQASVDPHQVSAASPSLGPLPPSNPSPEPSPPTASLPTELPVPTRPPAPLRTRISADPKETYLSRLEEMEVMVKIRDRESPGILGPTVAGDSDPDDRAIKERLIILRPILELMEQKPVDEKKLEEERERARERLRYVDRMQRWYEALISLLRRSGGGGVGPDDWGAAFWLMD